MDYVSNVLDNLKRILDLPSDRQLAFRLDLHPASLSNTIKRKILPWEKIITYAINNNLSLDEIFLNKVNQSENNKSNTDNIEAKNKSIVNENNKLSSIKTLEEDSEIQIPYIFQSEDTELRAYLTDKKIYIIDTKDKIFVNNHYYLLKSNNTFFPMIVSIDLDGQYILKNDDDITTKVTLDEFNKIEIVGKVNFKLTRETFI